MRFRLSLLLPLLALFLVLPAAAQSLTERPIPYPVTPDLPFERAMQEETRTTTGEPGPAYWTNTASYTIDATLDPDTRMLEGELTLTYHNESPDELQQLVLHLRQNLHKPGTIRNRQVQVTGGKEVSDVSYNGESLSEQTSLQQPGYALSDTRMIVALPEPIPSGGEGQLSMRWQFEVPESGRAPRMGHEEGVYFLGYWYPQMAVYDDLEGWTAEPYMGNGEFYMGFADYDVSITVPEGWLITTTGTLENADQVLTSQTRERLERAGQTQEIVSIVGSEERGAGTATTTSDDGQLTWRFQSENTRDFAFSASDRYVWDATTAETGEGITMIHALYRPGTNVWDQAAEFAQFSIEHLSDMIMPYPYPHMTAVEGIIGGGMEYPMITLIGGNRTVESLFSVTYHEISHMWFPMIVSSNEKRYTWMDEGTTSFNTNEGMADFFEGSDPWDPSEENYYFLAGSNLEVPSMRHADEYPIGTYARVIASYSKPAVALHTLRGLVGEERFIEAYREYARRWAYKHPTPYDFFNTFEDVLDEDLDWFWRSLFYETWTADHAVAEVEQQNGQATITIEDHGRMPLPVPVRVTYEDGRTTDHRVPVDVWLEGERSATIEAESGTVTQVEIDPDRFMPDVNRTNNVWERD